MYDFARTLQWLLGPKKYTHAPKPAQNLHRNLVWAKTPKRQRCWTMKPPGLVDRPSNRGEQPADFAFYSGTRIHCLSSISLSKLQQIGDESPILRQNSARMSSCCWTRNISHHIPDKYIQKMVRVTPENLDKPASFNQLVEQYWTPIICWLEPRWW